MKSLDFALLLSKYLTQYLPAQRNLSSNTICSYRDTFKLLLIFCRDIQGFNIAKLPMTQLDRKCIEDFILWLRNIRKSSPSTCNQRLCAIHAFFDYVMVEEPQLMETSVYKGYKQDKIEMRGDRAEMSDFPLYLNTVAGGLDRRDQTIGGFSFVVKIYALPVVEIIGQLLYLLGRYGFNTQFGDCL